ncbi:unnamed protein product [Closterium sp. Naga37s-1]|nr:unnamed protein product [Closterium sp. Naga37s-1]
MERPRARLVADILDPGRRAALARQPDHPTQYTCNEVGEPRQAWPTLVSYKQARGLRGVAGSGMVFDQARGEWEETTGQERELAMGFLARATACPQMTEKERRGAVGREMDLNALHWLITSMSNHLERKWLERRIGQATQIRPRTELAANKEIEAWTMLDGLEAKGENQWWRGIPEEQRHTSWRDERFGVPGRYADTAESEEEEEEEEEEVEEEESGGLGGGVTPEEFHDSDFDMEGVMDFFDPHDWPPIGPVSMALEGK